MVTGISTGVMPLQAIRLRGVYFIFILLARLRTQTGNCYAIFVFYGIAFVHVSSQLREYLFDACVNGSVSSDFPRTEAARSPG